MKKKVRKYITKHVCDLEKVTKQEKNGNTYTKQLCNDKKNRNKHSNRDLKIWDNRNSKLNIKQKAQLEKFFSKVTARGLV
jgi:hypothetical protein